MIEIFLCLIRNMRPSSPPATVADMLDNQNAKRNRPFRRVRTNDILQEVEMLSSSFHPFILCAN